MEKEIRILCVDDEPNMSTLLAHKLQTINPWHFVWVAILSAEILTGLLSILISFALWGTVTKHVLLVGVVDSFVVSVIIVSIIVYFIAQLKVVNKQLNQELIERKRAQEAIIRRDSILEALSFMAERFLQASDTDSNIHACLARLGTSTGVSLITMRRNCLNKTGDLCAEIAYEWDAPGIEPKSNDQSYRTFSYVALGFDNEAFARRRTIHGHIIDFSEKQRAFFGGAGIKSLLMVPIFVNNNWWGFIGLADCINERNWTSMEMDVMSTTADIIGAAIYRKQEDEELLKARDTAMEASRAKSLFLANMSHEIRTPMNSIIGFTELLQKTQINKTQREYLQIVDNNSRTLLEIINDILDLSKIESGKLKTETTGFDLFKELEGLIETLAFKANEKGIDLIFFVDPDLPKILLGDPLRVKQVMTNLIANAIKFTHSGGYVYVKVVRGPVEDESGIINIYFSIEDNGIGIPKEKHGTVLEPFAQADDSTSREFGGTGLGLTITNDLITMMGGKLSLESEPGKGARFFFMLAMATPVALDIKLKRFADLNLSIAVLSANRGERSQTTAMVRHLESIGCTIRLIDDVGDLIDMGEIDAVFISIPPIDAEAIKTIRVITSAPIFAVARGYNEEIMEGSFDKVIYQPLYPSKLINALGEVTGSGAQLDIIGGKHIVRRRYNSKVLVAEDVHANQLLIKLILDESGIAVDLAGDGFEAVEKFKVGNYDAVFMDVHMPACNGRVATKMIREYERITNRKRIPIVALTADAVRNDTQHLLDDGMDDYMTKPIVREIMDAILDKYLGGATAVNAANNYINNDSMQDKYGISDTMICLGLTQEMAIVCIQTFLCSMSDDLKALRKHIADKDRSSILETIHRMKGTAANLRVKAIASLCGEMETLSKGELTADNAELLTEHVTRIGRLRDDIEAAVDRE